MSPVYRSRPAFVPTILLIGTGHFGMIHLRILKELHAQGIIEFKGVVVRNPKRRTQIATETGISVYDELTPALLRSVDAVDIVTPVESHYALVKRCLTYTNVFVEKPITATEKEAHALDAFAKKHGRTLMVGHIFRFHPVMEVLKNILGDHSLPTTITGSFINPRDTDSGREPSLEMLHLFDIVDALWKKVPASICSAHTDRISVVDVRYGKTCDARFSLGWEGLIRKRELVFSYPNEIIAADFAAGTIFHTHNGKTKLHEISGTEEPLYTELQAFAKALSQRTKSPVDAKTAARVVSIAERAARKTKKPLSIAVIGGGIFGTSIAAELGVDANVTLFEQHKELLSSGTLVNQMRHHAGYHYPRSDETVASIQEGNAAFERVFGEAILSDATAYYGIAREGSNVTPEEFLAFCKKHNLPYKKVKTPKELMAEDQLALTVEVNEARYDIDLLRRIAEERLAALPSVSVRRSAKVIKAALTAQGKKRLTWKGKGSITRTKEFDIVINTTYARINEFTKWLGFAPIPVRIDLAEVLMVSLPIPPVSLTVMDGPFATLLSTGKPHEFTLYHARESSLHRYTPEDGMVQSGNGITTNQERLYSESLKLFPILANATILESRTVYRGVIAYHEHDDRRVADIIDHGFGCYSVLSGKILSSAHTGEKLRARIFGTGDSGKQEK